MASSKPLRISALGLRVFVFLFCLASLSIIATDTVEFPDPQTGELTKATFKDVISYRYLFSVAMLGIAYSLMQIPLAALSIIKGNSLVTKTILPWYIFTDVVAGLLVATAVGAGFGLTVDLKRRADKEFRAAGVQDLEFAKNIDKALNLAHLSTGFLLVATVCMAVIVLLSALVLARK
ncbi:CASP-like protein 4D1 [Curcuma longa]|uniref:CASP-like protein 4D1 n=1 Tax=Curcuma longa TaxID=136217 RepID=UPI003D9F15FF